MRLSIIIPVYNVDQYLARCVESCEMQDVPKDDYEIIIVNDGSSDNSLAIANELAEKNANIIVLSQENMGLSGARNTGMLHAKGRYLWFVDSDDWIVENCIGRVLALCEEKDLDICHFSLDIMDVKGNVSRKMHKSPNEIVLKGRDILLNNTDDVVCSACSNFYRKKFLVENGFQFTLGLTQQDVEFNGRVFSVAQKCMFVENSMYIYFYNSESICRDPNVKKRTKYAGDTIRIAALHKDYYTNICRDKELSLFFIKHVNSRVVGSIYSRLKNNKPENKTILEEIVRVASEEGLYPIKGPTLSWKWNLLLPMVNNNYYWPLLRMIQKSKE